MGGHVGAAAAALLRSIEVGANANNVGCGPARQVPTHMATERGYVDIMRAAIEHGANVDAALTGTAHHYAVIFAKQGRGYRCPGGGRRRH